MAHIDFDALEGARTGKRSCVILGERYVGMRDIGMNLAKDYQENATQLSALAPRVQEIQQATEITPEIAALVEDVTALTDENARLTRRIFGVAFGEPAAARMFAHDEFSQSYCRRLVGFILSSYDAARALQPDDVEGADDPTLAEETA